MPQSFSINTDGSTANASAMLDVKSTTKGMLIPRMSKTQKNTILTPASGLLVYQTSPDSVGFHYFDGSNWLWLNPIESNDWKITGNTGTDTAINFFGTTDSEPIKFKQNNQQTAYFSSSNYFIGRDAGKFFPGGDNVAFGRLALRDNKNGSGHVAIGAITLVSDTTTTVPFLSGGPYANTAVGYAALSNNLNGTANTFVGAQTGVNIQFGSFNTAVGNRALSNANAVFANNTSSYNAAFGFEALHRVNTADSNAAFGYQALKATQTGSSNVALGSLALLSNTSGSFNAVLGAEAFSANTTGALNTAIGYGTQVLFNNLQNATAIGAKARVDISNAMVLGSVSGINGATNSTNIGIGSNAPKSLLHIAATGVNAASSYYFPENNLIVEDTTFNVTAGTITNNTHLIANNNNASAIVAGSKQNPLTSSIVFRNDDRSLRFVTNATNANGVIADMIIDSTGKVGIGFTNPATSLGINGAITFVQDNTITANAATVTVTVANRTFFRISSDAAPATRKLALSNGLFTGQMLIIQCTAAGANGLRIEDADGNIDINGATLNMLVNDTITFIWDGNEWIELHRSDN